MRIKNKISVERLAKDRVETFQFDQNENFVAELLNELNEGLSISELEVKGSFETDFIHYQGTIEKKYNSKYGEYIVIKAHLEAAYICLCVNSGAVMMDTIKADNYAGVIDPKFEELFEHDEDTLFYIDGQELELYYFDKNGEFLLADLLREMIFLNKNPYPKASVFEGPKSKL